MQKFRNSQSDNAMTSDSSIPAPENLFTLLALAHSHIRTGDYQHAIKLLDKGLDADPTSTWGYYLMGLACYNLQSFDEAIAAFSKAIENNPKNWSAYTGRGLSYISIGDTEKAGLDFFPDHIDEIDPDVYRAFYAAFVKLGAK